MCHIISSMRQIWRVAAGAAVLASCYAWNEPPSVNAREIVRKSVELDQSNWLRMKDYTWVARSEEHSFDTHGKVTSHKEEQWETLILDGEPHRRILERDGKPLSPDEQHKQQEKLDQETARLAAETPEQKQRRLAELDRKRHKDTEGRRASSQS
jgi:hypothetical protein